MQLFQEVRLTVKKGKFRAPVVNSSDGLAEAFRVVWEKDTIGYYESMYVLYMTTHLEPIKWCRLSEGSISGTVCDVKKLFAGALLCGASRVAIAHNHPSGHTMPSEADKLLTKKVVEGCKMLDIDFIDHIILTDDAYYSFREHGIY